MKPTSIGGVSEAGAHSKPLSGWSVKQLLADGAAAWGMSQKLIILMCAVPFIVAFSGLLSGVISKDLYKWFTGEGRFAETMQVFFYALAFVLSLTILRHLWRAGYKGIAYLYLGLSFGLFFLIGEEINWGQDIVGWETPESLEAINKQKETNVHNIYGVGHTFKWIQLLVGAYGTILPFVVFRSTALVRFRETLTILVPHYTLVPYFLFMFLWKIYRNILEPPQKYYFAISEYNEVMELILSIGFALFTIFQLRYIRARGTNKRSA